MIPHSPKHWFWHQNPFSSMLRSWVTPQVRIKLLEVLLDLILPVHLVLVHQVDLHMTLITSRPCLLPVAVIKYNPYLLPVAVIKNNPYLLPVALIWHRLHLLPVAVIRYNPYLLPVAVIEYNPYLLPVAVIKHSLHLLPVAVIKYSLHLLPDCTSCRRSSGTMFCHLLANLLPLIGEVSFQLHRQ